MYFWESDPVRAFEWAQEKVDRNGSGVPFVIGAAIDLGNCLDLMSRRDLQIVHSAYVSLNNIHESDESLPSLPENVHGKDKLLRYRDCAVIHHLHEIAAMEDVEDLDPIDTVRGLFTEGKDLYPGSGFKEKTHIQIAVHNMNCIKGLFRVGQQDLKPD